MGGRKNFQKEGREGKFYQLCFYLSPNLRCQGIDQRRKKRKKGLRGRKKRGLYLLTSNSFHLRLAPNHGVHGGLVRGEEEKIEERVFDFDIRTIRLLCIFRRPRRDKRGENREKGGRRKKEGNGGVGAYFP